MLPGGNAVLFTILSTAGGIPNAQIAVLDLQTGEQKVLVPGGSYPRYVPTGHIVYGVDGTLRAVAFDLDRLEVRSDPVPVLQRVVTKPSGAASFSVAQDGSLVYLAATSRVASSGRSCGSIGRDARSHQGAASGVHVPADLARRDESGAGRARPGERHLGLGPRPRNADAADLRSRAGQIPRLDAGRATDCLFVARGRHGRVHLYWQPADGTGAVERLSESANARSFPRPFRQTGRSSCFVEVRSSTGVDIAILPMDGERRAAPLVRRRSTRATRRSHPMADGWPTSRTNPDGMKSTCGPFPRSTGAAGRFRPVAASSRCGGATAASCSTSSGQAG